MRGLLAARMAFSVDSLTILTENEEGELERDGWVITTTVLRLSEEDTKILI
jgi:hypothetical protein